MFEHKEIGGHTFSLIPIQPFEEWISQNGTMNAFMNLNRNDKETIFLRWKWGLSDTANTELESTRRDIMRAIKDKADIAESHPAYIFYVQNLKEFEEKCYQIRCDIGISKIPEDQMPKEAQTIKEILGGRYV